MTGDNLDQGERRTVTTDEEGGRLDVYLAEKFPSSSRTQWQAAVTREDVLLNDLPSRNSARLIAGDEVVIVRVPGGEEAVVLTPTELPPILYEDDDIWVFDKPAGLIVHPAGDKLELSVAGAVAPHVVGEQGIRPGIVHRLDRDTSGVLVVAKHTEAKQKLQHAWKAKAVRKKYYAVVAGSLVGVQRLAFSLAKDSKRPNRVVLDPLGRPAETIITSVGRGPEVSLVEAEPTTGRTHQIRVHLAAIKHPILGDTLYGEGFGANSRLMLHAANLTIPLPGGGVKTFTSPLPEDFITVARDYGCPLPS